VFNASKGFSGQIKPVLGADIRSSSLNKSAEQQKLQSRHIYREDQQVKTQDLMLAQSETGPLHKKEEQAHLLEAQSSVQHEDAFKAERSIQEEEEGAFKGQVRDIPVRGNVRRDPEDNLGHWRVLRGKNKQEISVEAELKGHQHPRLNFAEHPESINSI